MTPAQERTYKILEKIIEDIRLDEREKCAKIVESSENYGYVADIGCFDCFRNIAAAIRARKSE